MEGSRELYQYSDLQLPSQEIRLLNLAPALEHEAELHCSLSSIRLSTKPKYEAISYVWGSTENLQPLICEGKLLQVTRNLATALRYCRKQKSSRRLWVDAVCINQRNVREKSEQIELMAAIFSGAMRTLIWLGEAKELTSESARAVKPDCKAVTSPDTVVEDLFRTLRTFGMPLLVHQKVSRTRSVLAGCMKAIRHPAKGFPRPGSIPEDRRSLLEGLLKRHLGKKDSDYNLVWELVLASPWFHRVWTFQELLLSPSPILLCGSSHVPAPTFTRAGEFYEFNETATRADIRLSLWRLFSSRTYMSFTKLMQYIIMKNQNRSRPSLRKFRMEVLLPLLKVICSSTATEPSDNVIGSLAILQTFGVQLPPPYYSCSTAELYARATRSLFRFDDSLGLLMLICEQPLLRPVPRDHAGNDFVANGVSNLPSWALDWRRPSGQDGRLDYLHSIYAVGGIGTSAPANATRHSCFEDYSELGSGDELVLNGLLLQDSPNQFQYIAAFVSSPQSFNTPPIFSWATWTLHFRHFFGAAAKDQTRERLEEVMRLLVPMPIDIREEFDIIWRLTSDVYDRSTGEFGSDVYQLASESQFQQLFYPSDSMPYNMLVAITVHLEHLTLIVTSAGAIGFCVARIATSQENDDMDRHGSFSSHEHNGDSVYRTVEHENFDALTDLNGCVIALVAGLDFPLLLRAASPDGGKYNLISVAVLSGMMQGEHWPLNSKDLHHVVLI